MIQRPTQIVISGDVLYWVIIAVLLTPIITALVHDAMARRWIWLFVDILLPPLAVARGVCIWLKLI